MKEIKKGESWRRGFLAGVKETEKAFGGCKNCFGKGYSTVKIQAHDDRKIWDLEPIHPCSCVRGVQVREILKLKK